MQNCNIKKQPSCFYLIFFYVLCPKFQPLKLLYPKLMPKCFYHHTTGTNNSVNISAFSSKRFFFSHLQYSQLFTDGWGWERKQSTVTLATIAINLTLVRLRGEEARCTAIVSNTYAWILSDSGEKLDRMKEGSELHITVAVWETMHIWQQKQVRIFRRFYHW